MNRAISPNIINQPITKSRPQIPQSPKPHATHEAQATPPTYPFPAYAIVKEQNDGTKFPAAKGSRLTKPGRKFKHVATLGGGSI